MAATYDIAMGHAGRDSSHTFRDLRSASRARKRTVRHRLKYNKFKRPGLTPSDLPSSPNQQSHYIPNPRGSIESKAAWEIFPVDLSTAPVVKFTKREAYNLAQEWPRPPTYHHSRYEKNYGKWQRQTGEMKQTKRSICEGEYVDDASWFDFEEDLISWFTPFERYCYFRENKELWEGTEDDVSDPTDEGYHTDENTGVKEEEEVVPPTWYWHRNFVGQWFRADWPCMYSYCACFSCWNELEGWEAPRTSHPFSLAECLGWEEEKDPSNEWDVVWEDYDYGLADFMGSSHMKRSDIESEPEWDLVSCVESEAWSEILDISETDNPDNTWL